MNKIKQSFFSKYKLHIIYAWIILAFWIWQILDRYFWFEDPIWHLVFYICLIPLVTFIFGIVIWDNSKRWLFPFYAALVEFIVYIFLANWWRIENNLTDLFSVTILFIFWLTFGVWLVWVLIRRLALFISSKTKI